MADSTDRHELKYRALAEVALAATGGMVIDLVAGKGLAAAIGYMNLAAGALILWDEEGTITCKSVEVAHERDREILLETEDSLLFMLRNDFHLRSAYLELAGEPARSVFSLPIEIDGRAFGALIGIKLDSGRLHEYDSFITALAAVLALAAAPKGSRDGLSRDEVEKMIADERNAAKVEIAVAVNHHINNPLTALLGNLQLLGLKYHDLDDDLKRRLTVIEESARQINEVTKRLMTVSQADTTDYINGMKMTDFFGEGKKDKPKGDDENDAGDDEQKDDEKDGENDTGDDKKKNDENDKKDEDGEA